MSVLPIQNIPHKTLSGDLCLCVLFLYLACLLLEAEVLDRGVVRRGGKGRWSAGIVVDLGLNLTNHRRNDAHPQALHSYAQRLGRPTRPRFRGIVDTPLLPLLP